MAKKNYWDEPWTLEWAKRCEQWIKSDFLHVMHEIRCVWDKSNYDPRGKNKILTLHRMASHYLEEYEQYFRYLFHTEDEFVVLSERLRLRGLAGVDSCFGGILKLVPDIESYFGNGYDSNSIWHMCLYALAHRDDWSQMLECWRNVKDGNEVTEAPDWNLKEGRNATGALTPESSRYFFSFLHDRPEFELFIHIINRYTPESSAEDSYLASREIATYAEAICLYIALRNELNKLREEAEDYDIPLEEPKKVKPIRSSNGISSLSPDVTRIFDAAVEDGRFMKKTENGGYEWTFLDNNPTKLCFFLQEVYKPQSPPWEQLQKLFARTETLKNHASQMRGRKWYKEWLEGQRQVDWAKEIRDFVQSVKHTNEAPPVKQQRTTTEQKYTADKAFWEDFLKDVKPPLL